MKNDLPNQLKALRISTGLSQQKFADLFGVSQRSIDRWEKGIGEPDVNSLLKISEYFKLTLDELVSGVPTKKDEMIVSEVIAENVKLKHALSTVNAVIASVQSSAQKSNIAVKKSIIAVTVNKKLKRKP